MAYYYNKDYNIVELHYWLENNMHSMDAFVQNKCEQEFLKIFKEITGTFNAECIIETEPLAPGGLLRIYKIISKGEGKKAVITTAVISAILTGVLVTPITSSISKISEKVVENIFKDKEDEKQKDEKEKLEIIKLKQEIEINSHRLNENSIIERSRANFYKQLEKELSVEKVSFILLDEKDNKLESEHFVNRDDFKELKAPRKITTESENSYVNSVELIRRIEESKSLIELENESIEVTSPNFTNSGDWKGINNGTLITFRIKSNEFNNLVQNGEIQFKKGTVINCQLSAITNNINGFIDYDVNRVNYYVINDLEIETNEGRIFRSKK